MDHKPHIFFGSRTGKSLFPLRFSWRFFLRSAAASVIVALLALGTFWWFTGKPPKSAIGSIFHLAPGPWGILTAQPILIEAPSSLLAANFHLGDGRWYFSAGSREEAENQMRSAGLTNAQCSGLIRTLQPSPNQPDLWAAIPSPELIRSLSPQVRSALYEHLARLPQNFAQVEPFRITDLYLDDWLNPGPVPPDIIEEVKSLLWQRGNTLLFSDYNTVVDSLASPEHRTALLRQLTRKASLVVKLRIPDHGDIEPLIRYWGTGGQADAVQPLLASLAHSGGGNIDISNLLPAFARQRLYRFAEPLPGSTLGPDCHWTTFNFFSIGAPDDSLHSSSGVEHVLRRSYTPVTGEPRFGDVVLLMLADGRSIHSAIYIADSIVFTKNGRALAAPYIFSTMDDMLAFYPNSQRITLAYYRRLGT